MERRGEYKVYWQHGEEWWQPYLEAAKKRAERNSDTVLQTARVMGFDRIFQIFSETNTPQLKAAMYYLAALLAKNATDRHGIPFLGLKELYCRSPINSETSVWITTAMHTAEVPTEHQAWLNAQPCPCETLPHGFAWE